MQALLVAALALAGFLKGQLHLHSSNSGDSATPPAEVARFYADHGYDFIVFTDHERITVEKSLPSLLVLPGVELTQNLRTCLPPPAPEHHCLLHVNALMVTPTTTLPWPPTTSLERLELYRRALTTTRALGGLAQLNHPNFHLAADAKLVSQLAARGLTLMEIANQSWDADNAPPGRPSTEAIWDEVLSRGARVWGTATDDAHHYGDAQRRAAAGEPVFTGDLGFVMVRATKDRDAIFRALQKGDFYASTGVLLRRLERTATQLVIETDGRHRFRCIGSGGRVLATSEGTSMRCALQPNSYVRAVIEDSHGRRAWVQPQFSPGPSR